MGRWENSLPPFLPMVGITGGVRTPEAPFFSLDRQLKKAKFEDALEWVDFFNRVRKMVIPFGFVL